MVVVGVVAVALVSAGCSSTVPVSAGSPQAPVVCPSIEPAPAEPGAVQTVTSGGAERSYYLWVPQRAATRPTPVIIDFHATDLPAFVYANDLSPMADVAPGRGYLVVAPQGSSIGVARPHWTVPGFGTTPDDVRFAEDLIAQLSTKYCVDPDRVYATGLADGAAMSGFLSCRSGLLAAAAPVAGVNLARACPDRPPLSVIAFQGKADPVASFEGIPGAETVPDNAFYTGDVDTVMAGWAARGKCATSTPRREVVTGDVYRQTWSGCRPGIDVQLYVALDAGRTYPGGPPWPEYLEAILGTVDDAGGQTDSIAAVDLILDFFDTHKRVSG